MFFQGIVIGIDLPVAVELRVVETDPGIRGDTATGGNKPAVLETGYTVKVPLFIEVDDVLRIDNSYRSIHRTCLILIDMYWD